MNNRKLGIIAFLCAPYLGLSLVIDDPERTIWQQGLYGFIYVAGWMCSILALYKIKAANETVLKIQLGLLAIAQLWNILVMTGISSKNIVFIIGDFFWPLSNVFMIVTGISIIRTKKITGWKKYIPLVAGLWLPSILIASAISGKSESMPFAALYSVIAWIALSVMVHNAIPRRRKEILAFEQQAA